MDIRYELDDSQPVAFKLKFKVFCAALNGILSSEYPDAPVNVSREGDMKNLVQYAIDIANTSLGGVSGSDK